MDKWFRSKWFVRAISLAFAILFFVFVNVEVNESQSELRFFGGSEEMETIENVPVDIKIDSDNYVVRGVPESINMSLEGPKSVLTQIVQLSKFKVFVDLRGLGEGDHTVDMEYTDIPGDVEVYFEPKKVDVTIEERSSQELDVTVDYLNMDQLPEGYELNDTEVKPDKVTITSSKSVIDQIAIVKVFIDVEGITDPVNNREVPVNVYDSQGNKLRVGIEPENVVVSVGVDNPSKKVPIQVSTSGKLPEGFSLILSTVNRDEVDIFATSGVLDGIDTISTEDISLDEMTSSGTVEAALELPDGVSIADDEKVEVAFELEQTKTIDDVPVEMENAPDGQDITFVEPAEGEMSVTAVGDPKVMDKLSKDDIQISVDLSEVEGGENVVSVTIEGPDELEVTGKMEDVTMNVEIGDDE